MTSCRPWKAASSTLQHVIIFPVLTCSGHTYTHLHRHNALETCHLSISGPGQPFRMITTVAKDSSAVKGPYIGHSRSKGSRKSSPILTPPGEHRVQRSPPIHAPKAEHQPRAKPRFKEENTENSIHMSEPRPLQEPKEKEDWMVQKEALRRKFADERWNPRKKLSPDALDGIRALNAQQPEVYTTEILANEFEVSPEAIRRILKSKWRPNEKQVADRRERWQKRGEKIWTRKAELGMKPPKKWRQLIHENELGAACSGRDQNVSAA